jgi:LPXTG-site transpeptidase (sortase) family protein
MLRGTRPKNTREIKPTYILILIIFLSLLLFSFSFDTNKKTSSKVVVNSVNKTSSAVPPPIKDTNFDLPAKLLISKLNINATIEYIGLTSSGNVAVPANSLDVGWYKYGALPGNKGTAIIVGHVDNSVGQSAVFTNLDKLQKGDNIIVIDAEGQTISFTVSRSQIYNNSENPPVVFKAIDNEAHLNLITCTGPWDAGKYVFTERLVVFADKTN